MLYHTIDIFCILLHSALALYYVEYVECGELPILLSGLFSSPSYGAGSVATLTCNDPYIIKGSNTYNCTREGNWSGDGRCSKFDATVRG